MDWNRYIQLQCERTQPGMFVEPFNVASGALFFVAAALLWWELRKQPSQPFSLRFLVVMVGMIGAGSMTYHTVSRMWAAAFADALPIAVTALVFIYMLVKHILRLHILSAMLALAGFVFINLGFKSYISHAPDGYISLIPTLLFLMLISVFMTFTSNTSARNFALASVVAIIALFFRVIDNQVCEQFPIGTHFIWHSLMAVFFFFIVREAIRRHQAFD